MRTVSATIKIRNKLHVKFISIYSNYRTFFVMYIRNHDNVYIVILISIIIYLAITLVLSTDRAKREILGHRNVNHPT